ncbi:MAG: DNA photolyase [Cryobacterium sp.]|uniref:FAD-binding domain-containing protein n=1 Tax=Cryobacterium sp. TaxID=1926290 RepID=UPI0022A13702|nr:FAD-binding domain-containing protein [Cryobacterium sp.]MCY7405529.1 DNA photolyase [Cryobacterium sp.]
MTLVATRAAGLARLADFVPRAGRAYAAERNLDRGPADRTNVSTLSPWVRHRLVTEADVAEAVLQRHSLDAASKFVQEVYWRTYWKGWLELRPSVWARYAAAVGPALVGLSAAQRVSYDAAVTGRTGIDGFDEWARELVDTGYLHNHARMWFASIWIFTLCLPWQLGADFFMRRLLDGDPASNTLSWRWVGGLQTVGKTYLATTQNIAFATGGRFHPHGLATHAIAIDDDAPPPTPLAAPRPEPLPAGRVALMLHEDDLHAESLAPALEAAGAQVAAVAAPSAGEPRSPLSATDFTTASAPEPSSPLVVAFTAGALADGLDRAGTHFSTGTTTLDALTASAVLPWMRAHSVTALVTPYAPVGAVRDRLDRLAIDLAAEGVTLTRVLRSWDAQAWPHATRGFFPFREKIPALLRDQQTRVNG